MWMAGICRAAAWKPARPYWKRWRAKLAEEGNILLSSTPQLHGVFFNKRISRRDHVALYIVRDFRQDAPPRPDHEIVAHGFFPLTALPEDTGRATRARIAEVFEQAAVSELW